MTYTCPICGYPGLTERPYYNDDTDASLQYCPCCRFQFGWHDHDKGYTHTMWRQHWIDSGMPWSHQLIPAPSGWDPVAQLAAQIAVEDREAFEQRPADPLRDIPAPSTFPPYPTGPPKPPWGDGPRPPVRTRTDAERNPITEYDAAAWEGPPGPDVDNDGADRFYRDRLAHIDDHDRQPVSEKIAQLIAALPDEITRRGSLGQDSDVTVTITSGTADDGHPQNTVHIVGVSGGKNIASSATWAVRTAGNFAAIHVSGTSRAQMTVASTFVRTAQNLGLVGFNPRTKRILPPQEYNWVYLS
ncbi:hypothetical protein ACFWNH_29070 [Rhodococcus qingshengii]|uniref:hypothetical protein n=1 Tax=Rhodococcus qingshengii TaxID=334542 RepID=UPI00364AE65A